VLTPRDFLGLGSRAAVDQALSRLCRDGQLRRVGRGLYALPRRHPLFGELSVGSDAIAHALADRDALRLQPAGAYAANQLGLTEQVPMRLLFLTDGESSDRSPAS
jgi:predicted transcriptional regulator of viral defense system